ncbi:MAG TPA: regulatory iron-sulfur-containing complex subunit RicT, partial [Phycisphaerae bacterium]|nr:regulatory iron-sulfur-containing complex subunit RicT [Phycisphaerae bacterium]
RGGEAEAPPAPESRGEESAAQETAAEPPDKQAASLPEDRPPPAKPKAPSLVVRYGIMRHIGELRCNLDPLPTVRTNVVIRTDRGVEMGQVITRVSAEPSTGALTAARLQEFLKACGPEYPFRRAGRVLRVANPQDMIDHRHLEQSAREAAAFCREQIRELDLPMRVVTVEHLLGGERIIFYFTAEARVDFRELVRGLASQYRTRIEMRQVGARDEARLVADYERCGLRCCCQEFLKNLHPVSMRMAKTQKATLDPAKISGRCGRLMCCLRFEDPCYEELRAMLPKKNVWVRTEDLIGRVVETQILTQFVRLVLPDGSLAVVPNEMILERNVEPPAPAEKPAPAARAAASRKARPSEPRLLRDAVQPPDADLKEREPAAVPSAPQAQGLAEGTGDSAPADEPEKARAADATGEQKRPPRRRRTGRRSRRSGEQGSKGAAGQQAAKGPDPSAPQQRPAGRRRRRRPKGPSKPSSPPGNPGS